MGLTSFYGTPASETDGIAVIHRAIDAGLTFVDTAEAYGPWSNEQLVGRAIRDRRDRVVLATKFAYDFNEKGERLGMNGKPAHIAQVCEQMLKRLQTDHIDLFYQHRRDQSVPIEETVGAMGELVTAGKVRYLGLSEVGPETIRASHAVHPIAAVQTEYSLWERGPEAAILPTMRELGIGFVAYSPLGRGFLTGRFESRESLEASDFRRNDPRFAEENFAKNFTLVEKVREIARRRSATPAQIALAWVLARGEDVVPIPGTKRVELVDENARAAQIELSSDDLRELDTLDSATGDRYAPAMMQTIVTS